LFTRIVIPLLLSCLLLLAPREARAIQGCTLQYPDQDIRTLFPEATDYRSSFIAVADRGGDTMLHTLAERLPDDLDPVYEAAELPYAYYEVLEGSERVGFVFGVNQKGRYGGMQLILATDNSGRILSFYYQKLSSPARAAFTAPAFTGQFQGLTLADFYYHAGYEALGVEIETDKVRAIHLADGSEPAQQDLTATLRGVMKALILFDHFWLDGSSEAVYQQVTATVTEKGGAR
jgi:hypothetical protein